MILHLIKEYQVDNSETGIYKAAGGIQKFVRVKDNIIVDQRGSEEKIAVGWYINVTNENDMYGIQGRDFEDTYKIIESKRTRISKKVDVKEYVKQGLEQGKLEIVEAEKSTKIQAFRGEIWQEVISRSVDENGNPIKEKVAYVKEDPNTWRAGRIATKVDENGNPIVDKNGHLNQWIVDDTTFNKRYQIDNNEKAIFKSSAGIQKFVRVKDNIIVDQRGSEEKLQLVDT